MKQIGNSEKQSRFQEAFERGQKGDISDYKAWLQDHNFHPKRLNDEYVQQSNQEYWRGTTPESLASLGNGDIFWFNYAIEREFEYETLEGEHTTKILEKHPVVFGIYSSPRCSQSRTLPLQRIENLRMNSHEIYRCHLRTAQESCRRKS